MKSEYNEKYKHKQLSVSMLISNQRRCVSWRKYGLNGEKRRAIIHRFEIIGGDTLADVMMENIHRSNHLLRSLIKGGKRY